MRNEKDSRRFACVLFTFLLVNILNAQGDMTSRNKTVSDSLPASVKTFSRPEERGRSLVAEPVDNLLDSLKISQNSIQQRKIAKELGDRCMSKKANLSGAQKAIIDDVVNNIIKNANSESSGEREEAKQQIERLWQLAVPALLKYLDSDDVPTAELAAKSLILMRNEEIIKSIIDQANSTSDSNKKKRYIFILSKMREQRTSLIPGRNCLGSEESDKLYTSLVLPALEKLKR